MEQIQDIEQLIAQAMSISSKDERIEFVMNYFLDTVQYDYAYLFAKGYGQGTITNVDSGFRMSKSKLNKEDITGVVLTRGIAEGDSSIFRNIIRLQEESQGNYEVFINSLRSYINEELGKHLGNDSIVAENTDTLMKKIESDLNGKKLDVTYKGQQYSLNYDISAILIEYLLNPDTNFPPEIQNGLIMNGVCEHYSNYLLPVMEKIGVEAHKIEGTSELGHAWIIVNGEHGYKSIDLTRAVFIRDKFLGIPPEQTSQDWLYSDIGTMFDMQSTRTITKIDGEELPSAITPENYDEHKFNTIMMAVKSRIEKKVEEITLKTFLEQSLRDGISSTESELAEQSEQTKERDVIKDE